MEFLVLPYMAQISMDILSTMHSMYVSVLT